jgi:hypothetical protein
VIGLTVLDKKLKSLISERESDLNRRKQRNSDIARIFGFRDILEHLNKTNFKNKGKIWSPKNQVFLIEEENFVFLPISLLYKGKYLIITAVGGKGIHIVTDYKWESIIGIPFSRSTEEILTWHIFYDKDEPKELKFSSKESKYLSIENIEDESKVKECRDKLEGIIATKFFETFIKRSLDK